MELKYSNPSSMNIQPTKQNLGFKILIENNNLNICGAQRINQDNGKDNGLKSIEFISWKCFNSF